VLSTLLAVAGIVFPAGVLWWVRDRLPQAVFWFASFLLMLTPVLYFKGMSNTFFAERYLYIPSFAMIVLAVTAISTLNVPVRNLLLGGVVFVFAVAAAYRNETWRSSERLYETTL